MSSQLKEWLTKRRESKIIQLLDKHISFVMDTVFETYNSLNFLIKDNKTEALSSIERALKYEKEADNLDRQISIELAKGELPPKDREDLFALTRRIDFIADWSKDAALNLKMLIEHDISISDDILSLALKMVDKNKKSVVSLREAINSLGSDVQKAMEYISEVESLEHEVDLLYYEAKKHLIHHSGSPGVIVTIRDMLNDIERSSDLAEDAGDIIKVIAIRFK
ncbi:MAG: DUF47 domain-containing protein [Candidatus Asgardarchaeia archaeon]